MSILIKGVKMPTGRPLWIVVHSDGTVEANDVSVGWQALRNAAIPVPPRGRLIDADALMNHEVLLPRDGGHLPIVYSSYIRNAPTIIEAEEGEL